MLFLTRQNMHEYCWYFMDKQHDGMVGDGQQQEENHGGGAGHKQGNSRPKNIPEA